MSNSSDLDQLHRIILKHCYNEELDSEVDIVNCKAYRSVTHDAWLLLRSQSRGQQVRSMKSSQRNKLDKALYRIRQAQQAIADIPQVIVPDIRREHSRRNGTDLETEITKAIEEHGTLTNETLRAISKQCAVKSEFWIDNATQNALKDLYVAIETQLNTLPTSFERGVKPNFLALELTNAAVIVFENASGRKASYWKGGETPFTRFLCDLFAYFGIEQEIWKPVENVITSRNSKK